MRAAHNRNTCHHNHVQRINQQNLSSDLAPQGCWSVQTGRLTTHCIALWGHELRNRFRGTHGAVRKTETQKEAKKRRKDKRICLQGYVSASWRTPFGGLASLLCFSHAPPLSFPHRSLGLDRVFVYSWIAQSEFAPGIRGLCFFFDFGVK